MSAKVFTLLGIAISITALGIKSAQAQTSILYAISSNDLLTVDPTSGAGTVVGSSGLLFPYGIANLNGSLYAFDQPSDLLYRIDLQTGAAVSPISLGLQGLSGEGDLAFRSDGTGFLTTAFSGSADAAPTDDFYSFNIGTGKATRLGSTGDVKIDGLAFSSNNVLFGIGTGPETATFPYGQEDLYTIDQKTGKLTLVGGLGVGGSAFAGLTFGPDGKLLGAVNDQLYDINPKTGSATLLGSDSLQFAGDGSISGLAFVAVPEPSEVILVLGGCFLASIARRKFIRSSAVL
ncbi:MAG: PEP-CTERM sorting domain-containing protein [Verrucomicrobia bacterium]|nr:PEP-CTERM sorting domain-containing protein [Verrucomicrobiota bacterium]